MRILLVFGIIFLSGQYIFSQDIEKLYTGRGYWNEEQNERYQMILLKKESDQVLSAAEEQWFEDYHTYLKDYFSHLNDTEKDKYFENKESWDIEKSGLTYPGDNQLAGQDKQSQIVSGGKKYHMWNGFYGFLYGAGTAGLIQSDMDVVNIALPILGTSLGLIWQEINPSRYEDISINSVLLARHGKFMGALDGIALGLTIMGTGESVDGRVIVGLGMLGSLAGAEAGYKIGKKLSWTDGKVSTIKYYGILTPAISFFTLAALRYDNPRLYGATHLATNAAGYWIGTKMAERFDNTRGDMISLSSFTTLSTGLIAGVLPFNNTYELFIPIGGAILSTYAGHLILKDKKLAAADGWRINYMTMAGALIGFGSGILLTGGTRQGIFILSAVGGGIGWFTKYKSVLRNENSVNNIDGMSRNYFSFEFNPENYYFNKSTWKTQSESFNAGLPVVGLQYNF